ncbi:MAG TPA: FimV/HubP family polar landmark protein [Pseudomonadales bacterium]|nr:FimV/HubP family polar landmark protein [Pseudomonadales bacterium]
MTRKLPLLLVVCLGFWHSAAFGLGLGEIAVDSALNQRFEAEIELRNIDGLTSNEIIANLASSEDFERVGVERFFFLSDLQFKTDLSDPRRPLVRVTSSQPVTEPFVNFVVEVLWPSGRLLREYTVLLDPPTYAARPAGAARAPTGGASTMTPSTPRPRSTDPVRTSVSGETGGEGMLVGDTYGVTDRNDTLWAIALKVRPDASLSAQQTMLALLRRNPEAFIGGNINQLKAGYVLRVPDADEIRRLSFDDAVVQVTQQNERWREGLDREPLDARPAVPTSADGASTGGELRLVAAQDGATPASRPPAGGAAGSSGPAGSGPAAGGASAAELASARADAEALRSELTRTEERAAELERELELKNTQLARAQQVLQQQMAAETSPATPAPAQGTRAAAAGGLFGFSWMLIGGAVAGLVVLLALVLFVLRRLGGGDADDDLDDEPDFDDEVAKTQLMPALSAADIAAATGGAGAGGDEGDDVIGEADVYMVYGRFSEAARVLATALEADPQRADIRLKLLEVYVESGDADGFNAQAQALAAVADAETIAQADQLARRLPGAMTSDGDVTEGSVAAAPAREAPEGEVSLDFDLAGGDIDDAPADLDSLDIDLDLGSDAPAAGGDGGDLDLDFDLDVGGDDKAPVADDGEPALDLDGDDDGELSFELDDDEGDAAPLLDLDGDDDGADDGSLPDLDFSLDVDGDDEAPAPAAAEAAPAADDEDEDDDSLGIDFEFETDAASPAPAAAADSGSDSDFDIDDLEEAGTADKDDGDLDFDIGELAPPAAAASSAEDELAAMSLDTDAGAAADDDDDDDDRTLLAGADDDDFDLDGDDFDFGDDGGDEISTKLELARAYVDMGDEDGAREILDEVVRDGDDGQKQEAGELLQNLG